MDFDETGLYKGFVKNVKGQKYPGRNPTVVSLQEVDECEGFSGVMNASTVLLDADEQPYSDILQNIITGEKLGKAATFTISVFNTVSHLITLFSEIFKWNI